MHPMTTTMASTHTNPLSVPNPSPISLRPVAGFNPSPWGNRFLDYTPYSKEQNWGRAEVIEAQRESSEVLKEEIKRDLRSISNEPLIEQLRMIDSIERLGVAYHFEEEIQNALQRIHETLAHTSSDDLLLTSLSFRLLRHHSFDVSCEVFKKFLGSDGTLKEEVVSDVQGMLSFYEACHLRAHGEDILDKALPHTISRLKSIANQSSNTSLMERIGHALNMALRKRVPRIESVRYMKIYEEDDPSHNKTLLHFAKLDFNLLQALHKQELCEISGWWKRIDLVSKLPLRDRVVEAFFWATILYNEPHYSLARKLTTIGGHIVTNIDDIYDSYATLEELEIFTEAIQIWDKSCLDHLPKDLRWFYQTLILDAHDEMESLLAPLGRSQYVHYAKQEVKLLARSYMNEAKWRNKKYIPTLEEYKANDHLYRNIAYIAAAAYIFLGSDVVGDHEFKWFASLPRSIKSLSHILRILNDIGGYKFDEGKGLSAMYLESYKKEYGLSYEQATEKLYEKADELWKDVNEALIPPTEVPMPLIKVIDNMGRATEVIYGGDEDSFTLVNPMSTNHNIETLYIDSIPI